MSKRNSKKDLLNNDSMLLGLLSRFESIRKQGEKISESIHLRQRNLVGVPTEYLMRYIPSVSTLAKSYGGARKQFQSLTKISSLVDEILLIAQPASGDVGVQYLLDYFSAIDTMIVGCDSAIGYIRSLTSVIPKELKDNLNFLRERVAPLEEFNLNLYRHLNEALKEQESGHNVGSTLIAGKIVDYVMHKLEGGSDEERTEFLVRKGVLAGTLRDDFLRGLRKSRNFYSHEVSEISVIPQTEEAYGVLAIACELSIKYYQVQIASQSVKND